MGAIARLGGEPARTLFRDVVLASASIPGIFPPVSIDIGAGEEMHVDGGIAAPIYAVPEDVEEATVAILQRSLAASGRASMRSALQVNAATAARFGAAFNVISIPAGQSVPLTDFTQTSMRRLYDLGRRMGLDGQWRDRVIDG